MSPQIPHPRGDLFRAGAPRVYRGRELDRIAFPLGGIGTGSISLGGWGQLRDFEIFNRPAKGLAFAYTFFTLHARKGNDAAVTRVVQGPVGDGADFTGTGSGVAREDGAGLPHFREAEFEGAFPFARLRLADPKMPLRVELEAFNPFLPLDPDDSGLPVAVFHFDLANPTDEPVRAVLFANLENRLGFPEPGGGAIELFEREGVRGLAMSTRKHPPDSPRFGTLALATTHADVRVQTRWLRGAWFDSLHRFWDRASRGELDETRERAEREEGTDVGSIALRVTVPPGESVRLPVYLAWHVPNFEMYWHWKKEGERPVWRNWYATRHADAAAVAAYVAQNHARLERETRAFAEALHGSTLPAHVVDAASSQLAILKSTTCLRLEDGTFWAWEGSGARAGCCAGTCTHVWNYAQAAAYLFPTLERSAREAEFAHGLAEDGHMAFRLPLPLGTGPRKRHHAAADGQAGCVLRTCREWRLSGDDAWLRRLWPRVVRALAYAQEEWDRDRDGLLEGVQHNTYDVEFHGPNPMTGTLYLAALRAAERMARHLGEKERAAEYCALFESGRAKMDAELYNGEYYVQRVEVGGRALEPDDPDLPKYQLGAGCLSDQLIGAWYTRMLGLGDLLDPKHVRSALAAVFRHNWKADLSTHANPQRVYAVGKEAGLLLATWPRGGRPALPFPYSDEVWPGIEYQVASHLICEGFVEEGLAVVKGVRDRHDGVRRNPWNECECGSHYARSLASYALLPALSGFEYSAPEGALSFAPRVFAEDFACFFCVPAGWGMLRQKLGAGARRASIELRAGGLALRELTLAFEAPAARVRVGEKSVEAGAAAAEGRTVLRLPEPVWIRPDRPLVVEG